MNSKQRLRARFILALFLLVAGALAVSLYEIQIVRGASYAARAEAQYVKPATSLFDRGSIFFQSKDGTRVAAATVGSGSLIFMNPTLVGDSSQTYQILSHYLTLDQPDFKRQAAKKDDHYEELARRVPVETAQSISSLGLSGIGVAKETWRSYPGGILAAHAIGLVGENAESGVAGRYGLEKSYEDVLTRPGVGSSANVFAELFAGARDSILGSSAKAEGDVVTSLEPTVETYLEKILNQTAASWHPDEIGGVIMDPSTGEIVAMASLPTFNPNDTSAIKDVSVFSNLIVEHVSEMGSIMKPLTMAVGLDTAVITPTSTYDDTGTMTLSGKKIANFDGKARGVVPMQQILSQSLNVGAATIALKIGKDDFAKYFTALGFSGKTGIDQPNEAAGLAGNLKTGRDIEIATAAYGQGIAVSPISMARALSTLANGGYIVRPHLVKEIDLSDGTVKPTQIEKTGPIFKPQTIEAVTRMLVTVVDTALKQGTTKMEHYTIAAKTGTAQIPDHVNGGYYSDRYLHSFFGYFPAYNPRFLVFLYQIHPKGAQFASETLTDPFDGIAKFLINYYNIAPDR